MRALIIGASPNELDYSKIILTNYDFIIACDGAIKYIKKHNITPNLVLGDFDSYNDTKLDLNEYKEFIEYSPIKDYSDLELAIIEAKKRGYNCIDIINATGYRLDHFISNVNFLVKYSDLNITILDNYNKIFTSLSNTFKVSSYKYISFFSTCNDTYITLEGFKYNLDNYNLKLFDSLCLSNQIDENINEAKLNTNKLVIVVLSN